MKLSKNEIALRKYHEQQTKLHKLRNTQLYKRENYKDPEHDDQMLKHVNSCTANDVQQYNEQLDREHKQWK